MATSLLTQVEHPGGLTVWLEKFQKKRYEIASAEKSGNITRASLDLYPGKCGSSKAHPGLLFICWECTAEWPDDSQGSFLAEVSVGPAVDAMGDQVMERKIYVLMKEARKGQRYSTAFPKSQFLSKGIPLNVYRASDNDLMLSVKLDIYRLQAGLNVELAEPLLKEANERCFAIPAEALNDLLEPNHPPVAAFEIDFYRREKPQTSKKRKRPARRSAQESDSEPQMGPQYRPRKRQGRGENSGTDLNSADSRPARKDDDEEPEDQLAILEALERQEMELKQEAARRIQEKRERIKKLKEALNSNCMRS